MASIRWSYFPRIIQPHSHYYHHHCCDLSIYCVISKYPLQLQLQEEKSQCQSMEQSHCMHAFYHKLTASFHRLLWILASAARRKNAFHPLPSPSLLYSVFLITPVPLRNYGPTVQKLSVSTRNPHSAASALILCNLR